MGVWLRQVAMASLVLTTRHRCGTPRRLFWPGPRQHYTDWASHNAEWRSTQDSGHCKAGRGGELEVHQLG